MGGSSFFDNTLFGVGKKGNQRDTASFLFGGVP